MATRATYQFHSGPEHYTLYIHYDGYPSGAKGYFKAALEFHAQNRGLSLADAFTKANLLAELTMSHMHHADTEYRYTVDNENILSIKKYDFDIGNWNCIYCGDLQEWVNR